jgi:hypothetical protein
MLASHRRGDCDKLTKSWVFWKEWLADNPRYTRRFAMLVGRRCRTPTIKELEKEYMTGQLRRIGRPAAEVIGIDEITIRKGHPYRIVVSDLIRRRLPHRPAEGNPPPRRRWAPFLRAFT